MNAGHFLVQQAIRRHRADLSSWALHVTRQPRLPDALRDASRKPPLPAMARGLSQMARPDAARAEAQIERHLLALAAGIRSDDPGLPTMMRLAQGHWPRVWQALDRTRRAGLKEAP